MSDLKWLRECGLEAAVKELASQGTVLFGICGGYQMLGEYYETPDGKKLEGLNILPFHTIGGDTRLIGNIAVKIGDITCVGFENHAGKTDIGDLSPLGEVIKGHGNGLDNGEGMRYKNTFCTYLHGPFLSKNPDIADMMITLAIERRHENISLTPLDDEYERCAKKAVLAQMGL